MNDPSALAASSQRPGLQGCRAEYQDWRWGHQSRSVTEGSHLGLARQGPLESQLCYLLAVGPSTSHLTSLSLSFFLCKMTEQFCIYPIGLLKRWNNACKELHVVLNTKYILAGMRRMTVMMEDAAFMSNLHVQRSNPSSEAESVTREWRELSNRSDWWGMG